MSDEEQAHFPILRGQDPARGSKTARIASEPSSGIPRLPSSSRFVKAILVPEAIGMWLVRLFGTIRSWYHVNDEIYLSDAYQQQRAQATLDFYAHVWYPSD